MYFIVIIFHCHRMYSIVIIFALMSVFNAYLLIRLSNMYGYVCICIVQNHKNKVLSQVSP